MRQYTREYENAEAVGSVMIEPMEGRLSFWSAFWLVAGIVLFAAVLVGGAYAGLSRPGLPELVFAAADASLGVVLAALAAWRIRRPGALIAAAVCIAVFLAVWPIALAFGVCATGGCE